MKDLFLMGGPSFMAILTLFLIITTAWFIYHFSISYNSNKVNQENYYACLVMGNPLVYSL